MDNNKRDLDQINEKITKLKNFNIDFFLIGNYVDTIDEANKWCVAQILMREGDFIKVNYDGWSSKFDEVINIKNTGKVNYFRRFSKGYTGQVSSAYRNYIFKNNDYVMIKETIRILKENDFNGFNPLQITQIIRGKIFTYIDIFMTNSNNESNEYIERILILLYDFIDLAVQYYIFLRNNIHFIDFVDKNYDLALIDERMSVLACYLEINLCLKRIFGRDERVNSFFKVIFINNNKNYNDVILMFPTVSKLDIINDSISNMDTVNKDIVYSRSAGNFINYFAEKEGFTILKDLILYKSTDKYIHFYISNYLPFNILESIINIFTYIEPLVDFKTVFNLEINQFKELIYYRIANLTEAEIKETNIMTIKSICLSIKKIFFHDKANYDRYYEELMLFYNIKCLTSKNLEKRIKGITSINNIIDYLENKDISNIMTIDEVNQQEDFIWMTLKTLLNYLKEKNVLETFLGENLHEEILRRASTIFKLFAKFNQLSILIYNVLLKNCFDKHETIARQIEGLICDLSYYLPEEDRVYIFNKIKEITQDKYDLNLMSFIRNYSLNCLSGATNEDRTNLYGIPLLWDYIQDYRLNKDKISNNNEIIDICLQYLHDLLVERNISFNVFETYVTLCISNLKRSSSVVQSISLLYKCMETIVSKKIENSFNQMEKFLITLDKYENIIKLIVDDLSRYMKNNFITRQLLSKDNKDLLMTYTFEGFYPHKQNIESRLNLIYLIVKEIKASQLDTDFSFLLDLWDILIEGAVNDSESMILYSFLHRKEDNNEINSIEDSFSLKISEFLFNNILINEMKCNYSKVNEIGCMLFYKYFKIINSKYNKLLIVKTSLVRVSNYDDILGFETVWNILIGTSNESLMNKFADLLVQLCVYFKLINEDLCTTYWKNYYFPKMNEKIKHCLITKNNNGIKAILTLIKMLIKTIYDGGVVPCLEQHRFNLTTGLGYTFQFKEKNLIKYLIVCSNETVYSVRQKIAALFKICLDRLSFGLENKRMIDYSNDLEVFIDIVPHNFVVEVHLNNSPISSLKENPLTMIFENNSIFIFIFDLLHESTSSYVDVAWDLINLFPRNKILEDQILSLGSVLTKKIEWEMILDSNSIYKMLYTINIIKSIVIARDTYSSSNDISIWLNNFKENGGTNHLIKLIFQFQLSHFENILGFRCLNDILSFLLLYNDIELLNFKKLLIKLFEIILMILEISAKRDNDSKYVILQKLHRQKSRIERHNKDSDEKINDFDDLHPTIVENWNIENTTIINITKFFFNFFKIEEMIECLINEKVIAEVIQFGLIIPKNSLVKNSIFRFFKDLVTVDTNILSKKLSKFMFKILFEFDIIKLSIKNHLTSEAYFKILINFLSSINLSEISNFEINSTDDQNIFKLIEFMLDFLKENEGPDNILIGFMSIIRIFILENEKILEFVCKKNLFETLINNCLFSKCSNNLDSIISKCLTPESIQAAFKLLSSISYNSPTILSKIIDILSNFHKLGYWRTNRIFDWNISLLSQEKSPTGFVGLKNLGCICYMNSLMQQLFMIPSLREGILLSSDEKVEFQEESVLYNLKKVFSFLKASDRQYHNPRDFCTNFKNWEMEPINLYEQMDVDEFFNLLVDRLETSIKGLESEKILKDHFLGKLSNELICKGCPHYSEREENYFNLSLQVKNKKSLQESLEAFVQGEMLEGENAYFCEKCDRKVNTLRRVCIKQLPKYLIIVLKRFEFNYDIMQKSKLNDYCEFPNELDMEPYTQQYLSCQEKIRELLKKDSNYQSEGLSIEKSDNIYKYDLNGIIIHTGFAESGHYYSIIKDPNHKKWYEFNDTQVNYYDENDIPNDAFGGVNKEGNTEGNEKQTNAYLLFYKRKDHENEIIVDEDITHKHKNIQRNILKLINQDNYQYWISKMIFSNVYFEFLQDILINYNSNISTTYFKISANLKNLNQTNFERKNIINRNIPENSFCNIKYYCSMSNRVIETTLTSIEFENYLFRFSATCFFSVILRSRDKNMIPNFMDIMKGYINKSYINSDWLLEEFSNLDTIVEFLIECPVINIKRLVSGLIYSALLKSYSYYKHQQDSPLLNFTDTIIFLVGISNKQFKNDFSFIYFILYRISTLGKNMSQYLHSSNVLLYIILYINNKNNNLQGSLQILSNEKNNGDIFSFDNILSKPKRQIMKSEINQRLIINKEKPTPYEEFSEKKILETLEKSPSHYESYLFMTLCEIMINSRSDLTNEERLLIKLNNQNTMIMLMNEIKSRQSSILFSKLYANNCIENIDFSNFVLNEILHVLHNYDYMDLDHHTRLFLNFLLIDDSIKNQRVSFGFEGLFQVLQKNKMYYKFTEYCIEFTIKCLLTNYLFFRSIIPQLTNILNFMIDWLKENSYPPIYYASSTTVLFKTKSFNYPNKEYNQAHVQAFNNEQILQANQKVKMLTDLINNKEEIINDEYGNNKANEIDLTNYKFSVNDRVSIDNSKIGKVICVLDEMIKIEFFDIKTNVKSSEWFETNMGNLDIIEQYDIKETKNTEDLEI